MKLRSSNYAAHFYIIHIELNTIFIPSGCHSTILDSRIHPSSRRRPESSKPLKCPALRPYANYWTNNTPLFFTINFPRIISRVT